MHTGYVFLFSFISIKHYHEQSNDQWSMINTRQPMVEWAMSSPQWSAIHDSSQNATFLSMIHLNISFDQPPPGRFTLRNTQNCANIAIQVSSLFLHVNLSSSSSLHALSPQHASASVRSSFPSPTLRLNARLEIATQQCVHTSSRARARARFPS